MSIFVIFGIIGSIIIFLLAAAEADAAVPEATPTLVKATAALIFVGGAWGISWLVAWVVA